MLKIFRYMKPKEIIMIIICIFLIVLQVKLDLKLPDYMSEITRYIQSDSSAMKDIWIAGGYMMLCALGSLVSAVAVGYLTANASTTFSQRLRSMIFNKVISFSSADIAKFSTPSLITRSTNDIMQVQMLLVMGLQVLIKAPILSVFAIAKILNKSWQWSAATGGFLLFMLIVIAICVSVTLPKFRIIQQLTDNLNKVTRENLTGIRVIRSYNAEKYQEDKFNIANDELTSTHLFTQRTMAFLMPSISLVLNGLTLAIYWIGAYLVNNAQLPDKGLIFSDMVVFVSYAVQVVMSFMMLTMIFIILPRASVSARRINEVLDTKLSITDGTDEMSKLEKGSVEFKNVSFKYPNSSEYVLRNISFTAKSGQTVAFIGATGSGKTTLIDLIPRFHDTTDGEVIVNGKNVRSYKLNSLRNIIGYVSQKAVMFSGTVSSNVNYGSNGKEECNQDDVVKSLEIAQGKEFVEKMPDQYNGSIAQGGTNISGGQKQRLAIARAICRKPQIYIFDDSFSALDYKTDRALRSALKKQTDGATNLIVAQRIGTIIDADKIIVLDEGEIVGTGTHKELLKSCSIYREIAYSQLSKEELDDDEQ